MQNGSKQIMAHEYISQDLDEENMFKNNNNTLTKQWKL